jgi:hypothetical protein
MWSAKFPALALLIFVLLVCAPASLAQSGRRTVKPTTSDAKPKPSAANALPAIEDDKSQQKIRIVVARQPTSQRLLSEDKIYAAFVQRLNEQKNLEAVDIGDLYKREQAIKRARSEPDSFVALLHLEIDSFQSGTIVLNSPDLQLSYLVFAPRTGKQKYKGKVYYQAIGGARARRDAWPNGPPIKITPEAAAIAAADGLYDWLLLKAGVRER